MSISSRTTTASPPRVCCGACISKDIPDRPSLCAAPAVASGMSPSTSAPIRPRSASGGGSSSMLNPIASCSSPVGFAHGFCVLSDEAEVMYKCSTVYDPVAEAGVSWNDPEIGVAWPVQDPIISDRDKKTPTLREFLQGLIPFFVARRRHFSDETVSVARSRPLGYNEWIERAPSAVRRVQEVHDEHRTARKRSPQGLREPGFPPFAAGPPRSASSPNSRSPACGCAVRESMERSSSSARLAHRRRWMPKTVWPRPRPRVSPARSWPASRGWPRWPSTTSRPANSPAGSPLGPPTGSTA